MSIIFMAIKSSTVIILPAGRTSILITYQRGSIIRRRWSTFAVIVDENRITRIKSCLPNIDVGMMKMKIETRISRLLI